MVKCDNTTLLGRRNKIIKERDKLDVRKQETNNRAKKNKENKFRGTEELAFAAVQPAEPMRIGRGV